MATIDSVELCLGLSSARSGWDVIVNIYDFAAYSVNPAAGDLLDSKSIDVSNVSLISGSGPDWVMFTFDTPITIEESSFIGLYVTTNAPSDYEATPLRWYQADVFDSDFGDGFAGGERYWMYWSGSWHSYTGICGAYKINCTASTDNSATTPNSNYYNFGNYNKQGIRSYMDAAASDLPGKPVTPTPANEASDVTLDETGVTWVSGGNTDSYNVYYGTLSGFLSLVDTGVTNLSYTLRDTNWPQYGEAYYWRIDAVNEFGITQGDEWYFTTLIFKPPTPTGVTWTDPGNATGYSGTPTGANNIITVRRLCGCAKNTFWYESL